MKVPLETIRLSATSRDRLIQVKRLTGIQHWNEICRWGLCLALSNDEEYAHCSRPGKEGVEMTWDTFAGDYSLVLTALVTSRWQSSKAQQPNIPLAEFFISALEHGISMLPKTIQNSFDRHICSLAE